MPFVPATSIEATWPPPPSIVIDLLIVSAPKPPGSSASISPPGAVFEIAPAKVLQGAVREQGLASSPTPEIQVRVAWLYPTLADNAASTAMLRKRGRNLMAHSPCTVWDQGRKAGDGVPF